MVVTCFSSYYEKFTDGKVVCVDEEIPFEIPSTWSWCRMQDVIDFINGRAYKKEELLEKGKYKVLRVGNFFTNDSWFYSNLELPDDKYCCNGDLLYAWSASFGPQIWNGDKTIFHYHIWNVKYKEEVLFRDYLYYFLLADTATIKKSTTGSTMIHVSMENMKPRFIPIPPIKEQHSIVEKIQEILPVVEQYDNAQSKLDSLNKDIKPLLRKSILQEAIQGRLVPQYPTDEPASVLLQRIKEEKQRLVKEGKLKKKDVVDSTIFRGDDNKYYEQIGKHCIDITDCIPFDLPANWSWCRIENYVKLVTDFVASGSFASLRENVKYYKTPNYAILVKAQDFQYDFQKDLTYTDKHGYDFLSGSNLFGGELILSNVGSIGKVFIVPKLDVRMSLAPNSIMVKPIYENQIKWLYNLFNSEFGVQLLYSISSATAIRKFNKTSFKKLIIPIPPIEEQERIVKKIETVFNRIKG